MKSFQKLTCIAALFAASAVAVAQAPVAPVASTPAAAGYSGPSGAPLMTVKDLMAKGKDDQFVRLKGKITSHKGDEDYEFTDASGKMTVEIDSDRFPQGMTVNHNTLVELTGEFDKETFKESKLDVEQIKVVAQ